MWKEGWRQAAWQTLNKEWDLIIIGGGITGAGIFRRAVEEGYHTLLVESADFSSGTSSRSSKLIHGGFRYLRNKQFDVTRESVREREWLLKEARNLVTPLGFLMPSPDDRKTATQFALGVVIYDLLAPKWKHYHLSRQRMLEICPNLEAEHLQGGFLYYDAAMDDSRVVLRVIREAALAGGTALNYSRVDSLLRSVTGKVCGVLLHDLSSQSLGTMEVKAKVVINATGPWSDELRSQVGAPARLRKLRGSHLVFSRSRLDLPYAVTLLHPRDRRAMFAIPWEGVTLIGTTDLDHHFGLHQGEPFTTQEEIDYILEAAAATFPKAEIGRKDILSTFSGLRPVINTGQADPSKESRAHVVWEEEGLISITGGKFTTFRIMAEQALRTAQPHLPRQVDLSIRKRYFFPLPELQPQGDLSLSDLSYLIGRHGVETTDLLNCASADENQNISSLPNLWSELRWAARTEGVEHLDDLLLRRVRLGMLLPDGAADEMPRIRSIIQNELSWDDIRWGQEETRYRKIYENSYSPSPKGF